MAGKKVIAICIASGEFETDEDGLLSYKGGNAHAMEIDDEMKYCDLKMEVAEMFNFNMENICIKYFLPGNRKTLITISNDKDLKRMIKFHGTENTAELYVLTEELIAPDVSHLPGSRSSRTTLSEGDAPAIAQPIFTENVVDDLNQSGVFFDTTFDVIVDSGTDVNITLPNETPAPTSVSSSGSFDEKHAKSSEHWQNIITGVGQRFNRVHEFREALRKFAIAHRFAFRYKKNDSNRVTVNCKAEGCPWRIHASNLATTQLICIKKMNPTHTCEGAGVTTGYKAKRNWVASVIKEKLKVCPNYKPKDIVDDIKQEYGVQLKYYQAWRGKDIAMEELQGSYKEAYGQIPFFCEKITETNPGSFVTYTTNDDSSFHRLFVSFHASLHGFEHGCRPLLFLDSILSKSEYQGKLLTATATDGNDGVFPVAFAVVDTESDDNWHWFLQQLKGALLKYDGLTFVADREGGLKESIAEIFQNEGVYHAYCLRYLSEQLVRDLKGRLSEEVKRVLVDDLFAAAYASDPQGFQKWVEDIKSISLEAYCWVMHSEPVHWANAFFQGTRYNYMTSNFGELFYSWISEFHELPITQLVDAIRRKITELIYSRRTESNQWLTRLTPSLEEKLERERLKIHALQVAVLDDNKYEVRGDSIETVDVNRCDCSCRGWYLSGFPCCHAFAVIRCLDVDAYAYCARYFTVEAYRLTYSESVHPIPNVDRLTQKDAVHIVTPPPTLRAPGRSTAKKQDSRSELKRKLQCSRCKATGLASRT